MKKTDKYGIIWYQMRLYGIRRDDMTATPKRKVVSSNLIEDTINTLFKREFPLFLFFCFYEF